MSDENTPVPALEESAVSRKDFLSHSLRKLMGHVAESLPDFSMKLPDVPAEKPVMRPPGALPPEAFVSTCDPFCSECRDICPRQAIIQDAFGLPMLLPEQAPCVMCTDVPCTKVCPTGALLPLSDPKQIALGTAVIELTVCVAFQGEACRVCYDTCPLSDEAILRIEGLPQIVPESCTGCGVCVYECPTPGSLYIRPTGFGYLGEGLVQ